MLRLWSNIEFNSVIKHINRKIRRKDSKDHFIYNSDFTPVYSHPLPSHILRKNPYFDGRVQIKNSLYEKLGVDNFAAFVAVSAGSRFCSWRATYFQRKKAIKAFEAISQTFFNFLNSQNSQISFLLLTGTIVCSKACSSCLSRA